MRTPALNVGAKAALAVAAATLCVAGAIGVLVHRITAADQPATARDGLDQQLLGAADDHAAGRRTPARVDPPDLPAPVARAVRGGVRVTYLQSTVRRRCCGRRPRSQAGKYS
ncbi:hypothetical protein [Streptomyces sp. NPDC048277]|uniref:hypothetical protein n=1 Tax=Streptomyces sp. NPDC048277 TaxID=3155027 RepID=UPI0033EA951C